VKAPRANIVVTRHITALPNGSPGGRNASNSPCINKALPTKIKHGSNQHGDMVQDDECSETGDKSRMNKSQSSKPKEDIAALRS
jgi:hypothetical protein